MARVAAPRHDGSQKVHPPVEIVAVSLDAVFNRTDRKYLVTVVEHVFLSGDSPVVNTAPLTPFLIWKSFQVEGVLLVPPEAIPTKVVTESQF